MRFLTLLVLLSSPTAFANISGVTFTPEEMAAHAMNVNQITTNAAACLQSTWNEHLAFFKANGYSKFYGSRRSDYATVEGRKAALLKILPALAKRVKKGEPAAIAELARREAELETTSCVGLAMKCLGNGFKSVGMGATWDKIYTWLGRTMPDGTPMFYGTDLQKALVDLGWKTLYWNPDVSRNAYWDELDHNLNPPPEGKDRNPVWGDHAERWASALRQHRYYGITVHDVRTLVNFGVTPGAEFKKVPFYVGTAHAGYHVFPGFGGNVIEAHSKRDLSSSHNMEVGPFNPLYQEINGVANGNGAPRWTNSEHYRSGVIVVPPGIISDKPFSAPPPAVNTPPDGTPDVGPRPDPKPPCSWPFCS